MEGGISNHRLFTNPYLIPDTVKFIEFSNVVGITKIYTYYFIYLCNIVGIMFSPCNIS